LKTAVFVEGKTEYLFVQSIIGMVFGYNDLSYTAFSLNGRTGSKSRDFGDPESSSVHFQIMEVGNDERVLTSIRDRENNLRGQGFDLIVGLRDVKSEAFEKINKGKPLTHTRINRFIEGMSPLVPEGCELCFAVMEIEAWWLSIPDVFSRINPRLTLDYIEQSVGKRLDQVDVELIPNPASLVNRILSSVGESYSKKEGEIASIISKLDAEDINLDADNAICSSFKEFIEHINEIQ